jgi:hypothetical protein
MNITYISRRKIGLDLEFDFIGAGSPVANQQKSSDIESPVNALIPLTHEIIVYNPSPDTALTLKIFNQTRLDDGTIVYSFIDDFAIPAQDTIKGTLINCYSFKVDGLFSSGNAKLVLSNDTGLAEGDDFTATMRIIALS